MSHLDLVADHSKEKLVELPENLLCMTNLKMLFLEGNFFSRLPEDLFSKMPLLMWLDLRNNLLETVPRSVANHQHLENLLLTNNNIERLPNELGLLPKLKTLQIAENPLMYPPRKVIVEGTKTIKEFLKNQYELENRNRISAPVSAEIREEDEEQLINVFEVTSESRNVDKYKNVKPNMKTITDPLLLRPTLSVSRILNPNVKKIDEPVKIIHKVSRQGPKLSLKSSINRISVMKENPDKIGDKSLKESWLNQLRILLADQERILQQERNLRALTDWRLKRKSETPKVFSDGKDKKAKTSPPYAVYDEYSRMPTREELLMQLEDFFKDSGINRSGASRKRAVDFDKLINDLVQQIKDMEQMYGDARSPRSEMEQAGKQINLVLDMQKKLLRLKSCNESAFV